MGHALESILHYPYLKVELLSTLDWSHHIDNKDNKANQTLGFLRRNLSNCPGSIKELAYKALVRPHLEYASQVWDQRMDKHISGIEAVRQRSAQFVKDCWEWTPGTVTNFFNDLDWPPLQHQRIRERIPKLHQKAQLWSSQNDRFIELGPTETLLTLSLLNRPKLADRKTRHYSWTGQNWPLTTPLFLACLPTQRGKYELNKWITIVL